MTDHPMQPTNKQILEWFEQSSTAKGLNQMDMPAAHVARMAYAAGADYDWLPEKFPVSNFCSARGETFQEALAKAADGMRGWNPIKEGFYIDQMCTYADERRRRMSHS